MKTTLIDALLKLPYVSGDVILKNKNGESIVTLKSEETSKISVDLYHKEVEVEMPNNHYLDNGRRLVAEIKFLD